MKQRVAYLALGAAGLVVGLASLDILIDGEPFEAGDFAFELLDRAILIGAMAAVAWAAMAVRDLRADHSDLRADLARAVARGEGWREASQAVLADLGAAIQTQFDAWSLTPAESDIAGLLLKGVPLADIAAVRRTSQATIRQQAQSVYRKSGLSGRAELSAYFLESLFEEREVAVLSRVS